MKPRIGVFLRVRDEASLLPWTLANLSCADRVFVLDTGSADATWAVLEALADSDPRLCLGRWPEQQPPFFGEPSQWRHLFDMARSEWLDWYFALDADEVPNLELQAWLPDFLGRRSLRCPQRRLGVEFRFLYLAPGWTSYYVEPSRWPALRLWNYHPAVTADARGDAVLEVPEERVQAPEEMVISHWNWALSERFARKRPLYEARFGERSWHPDEKYPERAPLPEECRWFTPSGRDVGYAAMSELDPEGTDAE